MFSWYCKMFFLGLVFPIAEATRLARKIAGENGEEVVSQATLLWTKWRNKSALGQAKTPLGEEGWKACIYHARKYLARREKYRYCQSLDAPKQGGGMVKTDRGERFDFEATSEDSRNNEDTTVDNSPAAPATMPQWQTDWFALNLPHIPEGDLRDVFKRLAEGEDKASIAKDYGGANRNRWRKIVSGLRELLDATPIAKPTSIIVRQKVAMPGDAIRLGKTTVVGFNRDNIPVDNIVCDSEQAAAEWLYVHEWRFAKVQVYAPQGNDSWEVDNALIVA